MTTLPAVVVMMMMMMMMMMTMPNHVAAVVVRRRPVILTFRPSGLAMTIENNAMWAGLHTMNTPHSEWIAFPWVISPRLYIQSDDGWLV
jgi:endonuclease/exonuclease/phosphatase (EEP) superfamily protein YafD